MCNQHEHKLPISIPVTTSYQFIAYGLAIMLAHENIKNYYYDHYVQMGFKWHSLLDSAINPEYCPWRSGILELPVLDCAALPIPRDNIELEEIYQSITDALDSGKYIYIFGLDEFYLDGSQFYQDTHVLHDILIYGYDDSRSVFLKLGYNKTRVFGASETSYKGLFQALIAENAINSFVTYTVRPHERFYLYVTEFLRREIEQYNYGVNMHRAEYFAGALSEYDDGFVFGRKINDFFQIYLDYLESEQIPPENFDIIRFRMLREHKLLMRDKVYFLCQYIENKQLKQQIADIVIDAEILKYLALKTQYTKATKYIPSMRNKLKLLEQKEKDFCINFCKHLIQYVPE